MYRTHCVLRGKCIPNREDVQTHRRGPNERIETCVWTVVANSTPMLHILMKKGTHWMTSGSIASHVVSIIVIKFYFRGKSNVSCFTEKQLISFSFFYYRANILPVFVILDRALNLYSFCLAVCNFTGFCLRVKLTVLHLMVSSMGDGKGTRTRQAPEVS